MDEKIDFIINKLNKKTFIKSWIRGKYKEKPLIIYGNPGTGKTSLANYILKENYIDSLTIIKD